jgi:hypothetical protein
MTPHAVANSMPPRAVKPQTIMEASTVTTTRVAKTVIVTAMSLGILASDARWKGHTIAMMNNKQATGAKIERAK